MNKKRLSAGDFIDAKCTRCRDLTNHTIVAMVEERVVRVQCNTCQGIHNYHAPKPAKEKVERPARGAAAPRAPRSSARSAGRNQWQELSAGADPEKARPYDMNGSFRSGDLMQHPAFGLGFVRAIVGANKIEVLFESGEKLLRCKT
ncbi:hypothetical protein DESUT3_30320 [Desulfuromonas versatilis]|uniref:Uncharacterized protein n=1 Tax=Desulfuromonas versatilis TaxID=2802975 RepID=A0ABM8HUG1_9BACT|nr:hypothetical protein [Desulfuromonas versatilis]BCR05963.1 hypothetical protein DESUT3_30320 [Desulfuromonas versatilis]